MERETKRATLNHDAVSTVADPTTPLLTTPILLSSHSSPSPSSSTPSAAPRPTGSHSLQSLLRTRPKVDTAQRLLAESLAFQKGLEGLGKEEAEGRVQAKAYEAALVRAAGGQVKDDVGRLKKTIKKEGRRKKKSAEEWKKRTAEVKKDKAQRTGKRQANIDERIQKRKEQKMKKKRGPPGMGNAAA